MCVKQDAYLICCNKDEQSKNKHVKYRKPRFINDLITLQEQKDGLTYVIIILTATPDPTFENSTSHPKNKIIVRFLLIETGFPIKKRYIPLNLSKRSSKFPLTNKSRTAKTSKTSYIHMHGKDRRLLR